MKSIKRDTGWSSIFMITGIILCLGVTFYPPTVRGDNARDARQLVDKARMTLENFASNPQMGAFRNLAKKARGVLIAPQILKGAFIIGGAGGNAVLLTRQQTDGSWGGPSFYTIGEASFGLQIGGEASEVVLLAMTDRGATAFLGNSFKLGGNVSVAAGPVGGGASAASANLSADILSFSISKGLYGGISLDGAVIAIREGLDSGYYGKEVTPTDILIKRDVSNPQAARLIEEVEKVAGP